MDLLKMKSKLLKTNKLYLPAPPVCRDTGRRPNTFYVYAIACEGDSLYIGHTGDLCKRWNEHVSGTGADWTKKHKPIRIAHYEEYGSREKAITREKEMKTGFGRKWLKREIKSGRARQAGGLTCLRATHRQSPEEIEIVEGKGLQVSKRGS